MERSATARVVVATRVSTTIGGVLKRDQAGDYSHRTTTRVSSPEQDGVRNLEFFYGDFSNIFLGSKRQ